MDKIPEKFLNQDGTLNSESLIKSYTELEKKIGTMISVPNENSDEESKRKFNRAIGVPESASEYPKNDLFDDEKLSEQFLQIGLTKTQVEKIYEQHLLMLDCIRNKDINGAKKAAGTHLEGGFEGINELVEKYNEYFIL